MARVVIRDTDKGWKRLIRVLKSRKARYVDVGVMVANDARPDDATNTGLAMTHEFGLGVPERSFIRSTVDEKQLAYIKFMVTLFKQVITGKITQHQGMMIVGAKVEADMKAKIRAGIPPPNAPFTVAQKGSSTPLIDTGILVSSFDYEVGP